MSGGYPPGPPPPPGVPQAPGERGLPSGATISTPPGGAARGHPREETQTGVGARAREPDPQAASDPPRAPLPPPPPGPPAPFPRRGRRSSAPPQRAHLACRKAAPGCAPAAPGCGRLRAVASMAACRRPRGSAPRVGEGAEARQAAAANAARGGPGRRAGGRALRPRARAGAGSRGRGWRRRLEEGGPEGPRELGRRGDLRPGRAGRRDRGLSRAGRGGAPESRACGRVAAGVCCARLSCGGGKPCRGWRRPARGSGVG